MSKEVFIKKFGEFLIENVPYFSDLKSLVYDDTDGEEYLYCNYSSYAQKRIYIGGDSEYGIMIDFFRYLDKADWIVPMNKEIYNR